MNTAIAIADAGMRTKAQSELKILGLPAFRLEVLDEVDPVPVGGRTTYKIDVTNQGSLPGDRVEIVAAVPAEMKVVNANGPAKARIEGQQFFFRPSMACSRRKLSAIPWRPRPFAREMPVSASCFAAPPCRIP